MLSVQSISFKSPCRSFYFNTLYVVGSKITLQRFEKLEFDFNTLYVVGSITETKKTVAGDEFQYIICCRFKKALDGVKSLRAIFNTLYVVGSIKLV